MGQIARMGAFGGALDPPDAGIAGLDAVQHGGRVVDLDAEVMQAEAMARQSPMQVQAHRAVAQDLAIGDRLGRSVDDQSEDRLV